MSVYKNATLNQREFGADLLSSSELDVWLATQHWPSVERIMGLRSDFIQIEALLCAIEKYQYQSLDVPHKEEPKEPPPLKSGEKPKPPLGLVEQLQADRREANARRMNAALEIVADEYVKSRHAEIAHEFPDTTEEALTELAPWLAASATHMLFRDRIRAALQTGELVRLDPMTKSQQADQVEKSAATEPIETKKSRNVVLRAEIDLAKSKAIDPSNPHSVWAALEDLARGDKSGTCLLAVREYPVNSGKNGISYRKNGNDQVTGIYTFDLLSDRMRKQKAKAKKANTGTRTGANRK